MKRTFILISVFASLAGLQSAKAQTVLNATGGTRTIGTRVFDWSVGEMALVNTSTTSKIIATQGLLQNNIMIKQGVGGTDIGNKLAVFPNPASSVVNLRYTSATSGELNYRLMDIVGRVLITNSADISNGVTNLQLSIADLAAASYMLEVSFSVNGTTVDRTSYKIEKLK